MIGGECVKLEENLLALNGGASGLISRITEGGHHHSQLFFHMSPPFPQTVYNKGPRGLF
jgi:hypothetical protein